ncbi:hypothetical protein B0T16DRAFT_225252 [Cercophora newfieldiana]|uniref:Transmembrane protein n=1 Tax=Cercophora newfieldiana TaxID=92897 RepID=A0AA40CKV0_9PEZI|nr:hypothetical protein B0T16DRAFT_225252 [Cercophora newfieldiana]
MCASGAAPRLNHWTGLVLIVGRGLPSVCAICDKRPAITRTPRCKAAPFLFVAASQARHALFLLHFQLPSFFSFAVTASFSLRCVVVQPGSRNLTFSSAGRPLRKVALQRCSEMLHSHSHVQHLVQAVFPLEKKRRKGEKKKRRAPKPKRKSAKGAAKLLWVAHEKKEAHFVGGSRPI